MKIALMAVVALLSAAQFVDAQELSSKAMAALNVLIPRDAEVQLALLAAPQPLRAGAAVYVYGPKGYELVRAGTNGFTCLVNRDAFLYGSDAFKPTCWDKEGAYTYVPVMLMVGGLLARGESPEAVRTAIASGFSRKTFRAPRTTGIAYMLMGDVQIDPTTGKVTRQLFAGHYMFYALETTNAQLGYSRETAAADPTIPSVFSGGAGGNNGLAYIIAVPGDAHRGMQPVTETAAEVVHRAK